MNLEESIEIMRADLIRSTQEIVKIKSVEAPPLPGAPFGEGVNKALLYVLELAASFGFKTVNLNGYMGYAEYGDGDEIVGILGHLDIVPEGDGWSYDPYGGQIHNNKIYGRGTQDDKGPIIAALYGLRAVKDSRLPLNKKVRIIFGTDEESGWLDIDYYKKNDIAPNLGFTPDGMFPVINAEKGAINIEFKKEIVRKSKGMISIKSLNGGRAVNIVPDFCSCELKLKDMAKLMLRIQLSYTAKKII
jgi:succinyl-diaminopimelate desuccinylase